MRKEERKQLWTYIAASYGLFWSILIIAFTMLQIGIINVDIDGDSLFITFIKILISWTPTMAVYFFRKRLFPGKSIKDIFSGMFSEKLNVKLFLTVIILEVLTYLIASIVVSVYDNVPLISQWTFSKELFISSFLICLFTGATGEESGWRGFLFPHLFEHYGCIKSGLIVGIIWGLWHFPLWLLSGYTGVEFLLYVTEFLICTIAWSVVMGVLYTWNHNLILFVAYHFFVNFLLCFFCGNDLIFQITIALLAVLTAIGFAIAYLRHKN